jgi:hypothetical protein
VRRNNPVPTLAAARGMLTDAPSRACQMYMTIIYCNVT